MHEHIGNYLPDSEVRTVKIMHTQYLGHHGAAKHQRGDVENYINDQQILNYSGDIGEWGHR